MPAVLDSVPFEEEEHYPYDIVWLANKEDDEFLKELNQKYKVEIKDYPCIRVTTADEAEQTAIPESVYEKMTGEEISLDGEEIFVIHQRERSERGCPCRRSRRRAEKRACRGER
jgi:predicted RNA-binding protein with PIN domain